MWALFISLKTTFALNCFQSHRHVGDFTHFHAFQSHCTHLNVDMFRPHVCVSENLDMDTQRLDQVSESRRVIMTTSELFVPRRAPFNSFMTKTKCTNIKLHVCRGFIMDCVDEFVPEWLKCVTGVVDSEDIPRNISLESLQENRVLRGMNKNLAKNCFEMLAEIAEKKDD